jgi:hypothetical protein
MKPTIVPTGYQLSLLRPNKLTSSADAIALARSALDGRGTYSTHNDVE